MDPFQSINDKAVEEKNTWNQEISTYKNFWSEYASYIKNVVLKQYVEWVRSNITQVLGDSYSYENISGRSYISGCPGISNRDSYGIKFIKKGGSLVGEISLDSCWRDDKDNSVSLEMPFICRVDLSFCGSIIGLPSFTDGGPSVDQRNESSTTYYLDWLKKKALHPKLHFWMCKDPDRVCHVDDLHHYGKHRKLSFSKEHYTYFAESWEGMKTVNYVYLGEFDNFGDLFDRVKNL